MTGGYGTMKEKKLIIVNDGDDMLSASIYGREECPDLWVLRRFRDDFMLDSRFSRGVLRAYYGLGPAAVRHLGQYRFFRRFWRGLFDMIIDLLVAQGYPETPYSGSEAVI